MQVVLNKARIALSLVSSLVLVACGGGTDNLQTGRFIDDPVSGLSYSCSNGNVTTEGTTNDLGQFNYRPGQSCTFKIGKVTLGTINAVPADGIVTPQDVAGVVRSATSAPSAQVIAQLLHSLNDGSVAGKIVIPSAARTALDGNAVTPVTLVTSSGAISQIELQSLLQNVSGATLVSAETATAALDRQISQGTVSTSIGSVSTTAQAVLNSIGITSELSSKAAGLTTQLTATGYYSDGTKADITNSVQWNSLDTSILTVSSSGVAKGLVKGSGTVTASIQPAGASAAVTGSFVQTVLEPTITNLVISYVQSGLSTLQKGASTALKALATFSDSTTQTVSSLVDWVAAAITGSSGAATVTNSNTGSADATLAGTSVGDVTVSGRYGGLSSNTLSLTVTPAIISGVAASGAPMANAEITITCGDGSTRTGTADSSGAFSVDVSAGCPAPYVLVATAIVGDVKQTFVSVQPTEVSGTAIVNITPLTNAISSTLASNGDPLSLAQSIASQVANITAEAVAARNAALVASLSQTMLAAGVQGTPNLLTTSFSADRTGLDKVLDNLKVIVSPAGVSITNTAATKVDDMANVGSASVSTDLSAATINISNSTNFTAGLPALPAAAEDSSVVDRVQTALNACFALSASNRINTTTGDLLGACADLLNGFLSLDYKHDGKNIEKEFSRMMTGSAYDGAKFLKPEIIRFYSSSPTDSRALIRFGLQRADGIGEWFTSVAEKSANTGNTWKLRGNQRDYKVFVNGYIVREEQIESRGSGNSARPAGAYYHSGINLYFGINDSNNPAATTTIVKYVRVKGPGLPDAGVYLRPMAGCDFYYAIASSAVSVPTTCTSTYRMQYRKATGSDPENAATQSGFSSILNNTDAFYSQPAKTDAELQAIKPFSAYKFEIFNTTNNTNIPDLVYVERLRSRPVTLGTNADIGNSEVDKLTFNTGLSSSVKTLINAAAPSTAFTGGASFTLSWNNVSGAPPVNSVQVQSRPTGGANGPFYQDETNVRFTATSAVLRNGGVAWGDMSKATTSGNFNFVQLRGRDINDLQYFHNWRY